MKSLLLATVLLAVLALTHAAQKREVAKRFVAHTIDMSSLPQHLSLGSRSGFRQVESARTAKGSMRQKLCQTMDGLELVGAIADVELNSNGLITGSVSGMVAYNVEQDIADTDSCKRDTEELVTRARVYLKENHQVTLAPDVELDQLQVTRKIYFDGDEGEAKLVYELGFFVELFPTPCRPFFLMDACDPSLNVIIYFDRIHNMTLEVRERRQAQQCDTTQRPTSAPTTPVTGACPAQHIAQGVGGNPKTGQITYGVTRPYCLRTAMSGATCTMTSRYGEVIDLENTRSTGSRTAVEFNCAQGYSDPINGAYGVANDAFYYGYSTGQLYEEWYNFRALPYVPKLRVHYGNCYENAFWNGVDMTFGDGCNSLYPLVSQDVVAHELGHGITTRNSDLYYSGQSGGINEAFSDMSGEVAELFSTNRNDWLVGYHLFKSDRSLRYFETPSRDGRSIDSANDFYNNLDVHYSSGVFNRAFWQLVNVQGLPLRQAYEVFLLANRVVWTQTTNFQQGACGAMKAANDLGYDVNKIKNAFAVVDIDLSSCNYQSFDQTILAGERREFVMVSTLRNPVFALSEIPDSTIVIDVVSNQEIIVSVTSDAAGSDVVLSGPAPLVVPVTLDTAYFKLSTDSDKDLYVEVSVDASA